MQKLFRSMAVVNSSTVVRNTSMRRHFPPLLAVLALLTACSGTPPATLGSAVGGLAPCPESPNCVSSLAADAEHAIAPFRYTFARERMEGAILQALGDQDRAQVTLQEPGYIRAEFTSLIMRFVDDVEFWLEQPGVVHVRSASRLGYSDLGANRKRVERLREELAPVLHD